jgi:predicted metal-binding membrane protein
MNADGTVKAAAALIFVISAAVIGAWCGSMSGMHGMSMPGGWTMSMAWMRMPGQTWFGAGLSFMGMWAVMMVAMMLPVLLPALLRNPRLRDRREAAWMSAGYFTAWILLGALLFPAGVLFAELAMRSPSVAAVVPLSGGAILLAAGLLQFTAWKARRLECCRKTCLQGSAYRQGLALGWRCCYCCAGLTAALLVMGVMNLAAMALVAVATAWERLARGTRVARLFGSLLVILGLASMTRALITQ